MLVISVDRSVNLLPLGTCHWTIFIIVHVHFIHRRSALRAGGTFWRKLQVMIDTQL